MDIIKLNGGQPANFLDVGGGATPQAIKQAFDLITSDPKVTAIFVNIFGGIVRCDAIAQGLISVVESMNLRTPIVARLQGTNMEKAHQLVSRLHLPILMESSVNTNVQINESGLKIFSIEDLQSAAEKSVQFSKVVKMGNYSKVPSLQESRLNVMQLGISMSGWSSTLVCKYIGFTRLIREVCVAFVMSHAQSISVNIIECCEPPMAKFLEYFTYIGLPCSREYNVLT